VAETFDPIFLVNPYGTPFTRWDRSGALLSNLFLTIFKCHQAFISSWLKLGLTRHFYPRTEHEAFRLAPGQDDKYGEDLTNASLGTLRQPCPIYSPIASMIQRQLAEQSTVLGAPTSYTSRRAETLIIPTVVMCSQRQRILEVYVFSEAHSVSELGSLYACARFFSQC
jgi:hypothetical protein